MEIKKSDSAELDEQRGTFFLLGLVVVFTFIFVGLQWQSGGQDDDGLAESIEDISQDMELSVPQDQKDMVSTEAVSSPASNAITQQVKAVEKVEQTPSGISTTTSELLVGEGSGAVDGADVMEVAPETPVDADKTSAMNEVPLNFTVVQQIPVFPGGWSAFMQWLTKNLRYPVVAQQRKIQGMVVVSFIVNKDGTVSELKVSTSVDPLLDGEALRVMKMMPKWKPGKDRGKACRTMVTVPVVFKI